MKKLILIIALCVSSCCSVREDNAFRPSFNAPPFVIIYKTVANYDSLVPVTFDRTKKEIVSYPDPQDLKVAEGLATPLHLEGDYLLDRRGIGTESVFLDITYSEYASYASAPNADTLCRHIAVSSAGEDPFIEIYNCGSLYSYDDPTARINELIKQRRFDLFKRIK